MSKLQVIEYSGQRVLTTSQIAESLGAEQKLINNNFGRNRERYTLGKHYFELRGQELEEFKASHQIDDNLKYAPVIYLWTEKGAWLQTKSLNTDRAWEAYEMLVDDYYRIKEQQIDVSLLSPEMQMFKMTFDAVAKIQLEQARNERELGELKEVVTTIQDTFLERDDDWRNMIKGMINGAAFRTSRDHGEIRSESYKLLESRAHCDLNRRLRGLRKRLEDAGATKTKINMTNRMDVIENDPKLKEIYTTIVKELSIGTLKIAK